MIMRENSFHMDIVLTFHLDIFCIHAQLAMSVYITNAILFILSEQIMKLNDNRFLG